MVVRIRASLPALMLVACSPAAAVDAPVSPPRAIGVEEAASKTPASGWHYHPPEMAEVRAGWPLADGRWLLVGDLGERWLTEPLPRQPSAAAPARTYRAQPSTYRAPDRLVGVTPWQESRSGAAHRWLFVGEGGTLYTAEEPLGPLTAGAAAPHPLRRVAAAGGSAVGVDLLGHVYLHQGDAWQDAADAGPLLHDVASAASGELLGLAMPEALWRSVDQGRSWSQLAQAPFGAHQLVRLRDGVVIVRGATSDMRWSGADGLEAVTGEAPLTLPASTSSAQIELLPPRGPRSSAIEQRMAVLSGDLYTEVFEQEPRDEEGDEEEDRHSRWMLARGTVGADLELRSLDLESTCEGGVVLAARDSHLLIVCGRSLDDGVGVDLFRSSNGGEQIEQLPATGLVARAEVSVTLSPDGTALLTGLCLETEGETSCTPKGPLRLGASATRTEPTQAGDLTGPAESPIFSDDGERAYFAGHRAKDGGAALFVSMDAGKTFSSHPLSPPKGTPGAWRAATDEVDVTLTPGADGEVGVILRGEPPRYLIASADGQVTAVASLPAETVAVSGQGRSILALGVLRDAVGKLELSAFESLDAGGSFRPVSPPLHLRLDELDSPTVHCSSGGCVIGDRLTRVGWGGTEAMALPRPPSVQGAAQPALRQAVRCTLDEASGWAHVDQVVGRGDSVAPSAFQAFRGRAQWSLLRYADDSGVVDAVSALSTAGKFQIDRHTLLGPVKDRSRVAYHVAPQMEGYAAVRVPLPTARDALAGQPLLGVELGWINYVRAEQGHALLPDAGRFDVDHVTPGARPQLMTSLLSVSPGGVFLRPSSERRDIFVLDVDGRLRGRADYPSWPATRASSGRSEAVLVAGGALAVGLFSDSPRGTTTTLSLAPLDFASQASGPASAPATPTASPATFVSVAPVGLDQHVELRWTYRGAEVGTVVLILDPQDNRGRGYFAPFTSDGRVGAAVAVPTQLDLSAAPRACSDVEVRDTARVVAPYMSGTRHPLVIASAEGSWTLLTSRAVLHGTPSNPCVLGWDAEDVGRGGQGVTALVAGDMKSGWLFHSLDGGRLEHRPLRCEPSPDEALPQEIWREPGTVVTP